MPLLSRISIGLAEYIAGYKGTRVEVPEGFASSLHRAIAVRRLHGGDISEALVKMAESEASDARHSYFVGVLVHVPDTLRPLMPECLKNMEPATKPADTERLSRLFSKPELFEPSEDFLNAPDATPSVPGEPPSTARYEAERLQDLEEAFMLFQLLMQGMLQDSVDYSRNMVRAQDGDFRPGLRVCDEQHCGGHCSAYGGRRGAYT